MDANLQFLHLELSFAIEQSAQLVWQSCLISVAVNDYLNVLHFVLSLLLLHVLQSEWHEDTP